MTTSTDLLPPWGVSLPIFPTIRNVPVSEERLELAIELLVDRADAALMAGKVDQDGYDAWSAALDDWAKQYR